MRPTAYLSLVLLITVTGSGMLSASVCQKRATYHANRVQARKVVGAFGLSDLVVSTEARYTRHPSVSDPLVPFMDHPGGLEHFPTGSFIHPVPR